jgi:GNAT superfamily N-acetyltransferase
VVTFSNRCFPSKAIRGWLVADDAGRCGIVAAYFAAGGVFGAPTIQRRNPGAACDPLYAIWASRLPAGIRIRPAGVRDQAVISDMQYEALFVPTGAEPPPRALLDEPEVRRYHADFGCEADDVGRIAVSPDGDPIGAAWVRHVDRGYGFVDAETPELAIAVTPAWRGRGVGSALLGALLDTVPRCSLSVDARNRARRLYERVGFDVVRTEGEHSLVMVRDGAGEAIGTR